MAPSKKPAAQAEISLLPGLKNCLVNLPASLVAVLTNANTVGGAVFLTCAVADGRNRLRRMLL
jgi:peroxin-1